jgi:hypothetical protein
VANAEYRRQETGDRRQALSLPQGCSKALITPSLSRTYGRGRGLGGRRGPVRFSSCILYSVSCLLLFWTGLASGGQVQFTDVAEQAGVTARVICGGPEQRYILESMSSGAALFDYDNDGDLDLYIVNGWTLEGFPPGSGPTSRLYRNDGNWRFTDVTAQAGVGHAGWGMGCCVGDFDNDGHEDLYVTGWGASVLYHNNGDGTFTDVTKQAGVGNDGHWGAGCAFGDLDGDGDLDLYVANYVLFDPAHPPNGGKLCLYKGVEVYCGPQGLPGDPDRLFRNDGPGGDGVHRFTDVSRQAGIDAGAFYGLGVVMADLDGDGDLDIYVANDSHPNLLYRNDGGKKKHLTSGVGQPGGLTVERENTENTEKTGREKGERRGAIRNPGRGDDPVNRPGWRSEIRNGEEWVFTEVAAESGAAYSGDGQAQAGMGVAAGDFDNDGRLDLLVTNYVDDYNTLYHNDGDGFFTDVSHAVGLVAPTLPFMGWGTGLFDYDNDGRLDIFVNNGHLFPQVEPAGVGLYAQRKQLFHNEGERFREVTPEAGSALMERRVGRGAAFGDIDNDGDVDIVAVTMNDRPMLLRNEGGNGNHWIRVKLVGGARAVSSSEFRVPSSKAKDNNSKLETRNSKLSNRDGIGAKVRVVAGGLTQVGQVQSGSGYLSQNDLRLHFGLGGHAQADVVEVRWPSGRVQKVRGVKGGRELVIREE